MSFFVSDLNVEVFFFFFFYKDFFFSVIGPIKFVYY